MKYFQLFIIFFILLFTDGCYDSGGVRPKGPAAQSVKIAMILPEKVIGHYAHTTSTAVFAYYLRRNTPFVLKTYTIEDESSAALQDVLKKIKAEDIHYVIAPVTIEGAKNLTALESDLNIFLPAIHRNDMITKDKDNVYYGAIDYQKQIDTLIPLSSTSLVVMYDKSKQGHKLLTEVEKSYENANREHPEVKLYSFSINKKRSNLKSYLDHNHQINSASYFLNTPLIKSTMVLSQLSLYELNASSKLSTQINYNPLIFTMTQKRDREHLYIANSISQQDDALIQANAILSNDITYNWINYTATVGADLFFNLMTGKARLYDLPVEKRQVIYPISIVKPTNSHFIEMEIL